MISMPLNKPNPRRSNDQWGRAVEIGTDILFAYPGSGKKIRPHSGLCQSRFRAITIRLVRAFVSTKSKTEEGFHGASSKVQICAMAIYMTILQPYFHYQKAGENAGKAT
jgi:hypothetical protein